MHCILITTYNRLNLLNQCIESVKETTPESPIFVVNDGSNEDTVDFLAEEDLEMVINIKNNQGLAPSLDTGMHAINNWIRFRKAEGVINDDVWVSYVQDDVIFTKKNWPKLLVDMSVKVGKNTNTKIGFTTGHDAPEHKSSEVYGCGDYCLRNHIGAPHLMAPLVYWMKHFPISEYGERGAPRGHPGNGIGSDTDWWLIRGHKNSVLELGLTNLVVPGILKHVGSSQSTWQNKELPESC